jgi:hypothetical protein
MSNTRYAPENSPLSQERYLSSPEFAELRGISGNAVTAKASILSSHRQRSLLYFLQAMSLEHGGLPEFVRRLLETFPERIGTPTMHKVGMRDGQLYKAGDLESIQMESGDYEADSMAEPTRPKAAPASRFVDYCRDRALAELAKFIVELCINPTLEFTVPGEPPLRRSSRSEVMRRHSEVAEADFKEAEVPYFKNIVGTLFEMQSRHAAEAGEGVAETGVSKQIADTMDEALRHPDRIYVIEGKEGIGKTKAAVTWCKQNPGVARYVSLSGATNKTSIFRAIAKVLGLASSYMRKATEMQARIEDMLQRGKLMLVIDEAAYMCPQGERVRSRPEMIDWVYTALANFNVPSVLLVTPVFAKRINLAEQSTIWNARQFRRRSKYTILSDELSIDDLERVAGALMPECGRREAKYAAAYGTVTKWPLTSVVEAIKDARDLAGATGAITFDLLKRAIKESRMPSDDAQARAFDRPTSKGRAKVIHQHLNALATPLTDRGNTTDFRVSSRLTEEAADS